MKTKIVVSLICMLLISVSFVSVVNAQDNKVKMKVANKIVEYCEKQMIPRYEQVIFERMDKEEVELLYSEISSDFLELSGGHSTTEIEIILWLVTLIATFFTTMLGYNPVSYGLCLATVSIICFIPMLIASVALSVVETTALGIGGALAFFDAETIELLIYDFGVLGAVLFFVMMVPILMILYLLALPVMSLVNMGLFSTMILTAVNDFYNE